VAFKQNLPVLALFLIGAGIVLFVIVLQPSDEDRLREAAREYAQTLGPVRDVTLTGTLAEITLTTNKTLFADFEKKDGRWVLARDLFKEFEQTVKAQDNEVLRRMGERLAARFNTTVTVKEGLRYEYEVARDAGGPVGHLVVFFRYPNGASGRYVETYRYAAGRWASQGAGRLFDQIPARP
jgi:hypothetical protein